MFKLGFGVLNLKHFIICIKRDYNEWQFPLYSLILSEVLVEFGMISCEINRITGNLK